MKIIKAGNDVFSFDYYVMFLVMLSCFLIPNYFTKIVPIFGTFLSVVSLIVALFYICLNFTKIDFPIIAATNIYLVWFLISTCIINKGNVIPYIFQEWKTVILCCVVSCVVREKKVNKVAFIRVIRDVTLFFFVFNLLLSIIYRNGLPNGSAVFNGGVDTYYLYGNTNAMVRAILPGILCSMLLDRMHRKAFGISTFVFFGGFSFIFVYVYHMVTGLMALIVLILWCLLEKIIVKHLKLFYGIYVVLIGYIELGILQLINNGGGWITKVALLLGKSTDFSGRYYVWRRALLLFKQSPTIGWGYIDYDNLKVLILNGYGAHNYILDTAINGGYVGIVLFIVVVILPLFLLRIDSLNEQQYLLLGGWVTLLTMLISEPLRSWEFVFIPILCCVLIMNRLNSDKNNVIMEKDNTGFFKENNSEKNFE